MSKIREAIEAADEAGKAEGVEESDLGSRAIADAPEPEDEVVAALLRQLVVLEGTAVVIGNMAQMLMQQVANLRAEVTLLDEPLDAPAPGPMSPPPPEVQQRRSGAIVEASLPPERRLPEFCLHPDALVVQTSEGPQRVCQDCVDEAEENERQEAKS